MSRLEGGKVKEKLKKQQSKGVDSDEEDSGEYEKSNRKWGTREERRGPGDSKRLGIRLKFIRNVEAQVKWGCKL